MPAGTSRRWNDGAMRWGMSLSAVIACGLIFTSCAGSTIGAGEAGTGTATPAASTQPPASPSATTPGTGSATPWAPPLLPSSGTGAYGYITAGPTCPVERPDQPCPPRPVSETVSARNPGGVTVASTHSDSAGRFAFDLSPGTYLLVVATASGWPRCPDTPVTVRAGTATRVDVSCDTGIR